MIARWTFACLAGAAWLIGSAAISVAAEPAASSAPYAADSAARAPAAAVPHAGDAAEPKAASGNQAHEKDNAEGKEEGAINPLDFQKNLALWTGVMFLIFYVILGKFAWKPISQGLDKREQQVADQIQQAQASNDEARRLLADYQAKLATSEAEVRGILEQGRRDAEALGQQILNKAKADTELEKQRALRDIDSATAGAIKELAETSAKMAVELAGKMLQTEIDPKAHTRLIEQAVSDFSKVTPSKN
jgi:F-type H+-transporting ATPase subunit b